tara:strand:+ start:28848 stop:29336 length:489 start_codon:yes stop_codon:yes gene_type:complete
MSIRIEKTGGPWPANRYGIILKYLPRFLRKFLIIHRNLAKHSDDDQFMECVLKMQKPKSTTSTKIYWDMRTDTAHSEKGLERSYNTVNWLCAISLKPIKAKFMNFDLKNFIHSEYYDVLDAPMIDSRILKSSVEFRKKCKKLLLAEREEFLKLAKKNAKRSL